MNEQRPKLLLQRPDFHYVAVTVKDFRHVRTKESIDNVRSYRDAKRRLKHIILNGNIVLSQLPNAEALSMMASTLDETHDGLAQFTAKLESIDGIPSFWYDDHPVWVLDAQSDKPSVWPIELRNSGALAIRSASITSRMLMHEALLVAFANLVSPT